MEGKIYKLLCDDGHYYIGSTITSLIQRTSVHKASSKTRIRKVYEYIGVGWDTVQIVLIEEFPCETIDALHQKEDEYVVTALNDPLCLNTNRAFRTPEQRKEAVKARKKAYHEANNEADNARSKAYREANNEAVNARKKAYHEANKEANNAKSKAYREAKKLASLGF